MKDDDDDVEDVYIGAEIDEEPALDPVAERCNAFTRLLALIPHIKDDDAKKEALMMLGAVRRSFKTIPTGDLTPISGGKT